jgi:hypothetical protein
MGDQGKKIENHRCYLQDFGSAPQKLAGDEPQRKILS